MNSNWDVIVCGGGTAGAACAIAAARQGAKTLVVERYGALGGTQTQAWVTPLMPNYIGPHKLSRGVNLDILAAQSKLQPYEDQVEHGDAWYDPAALALVLDRLVRESGATSLFDACLVGVKRSGANVRSVVVATRGGQIELDGKAFVDCTGDADLSRLAGAEVMEGNEDGVHQPMTLRFTMGNIDLVRFRAFATPYLRTNTESFLECGYGEAKTGAMGPLVLDGIAEGILQEDDLGYFQFFTVNGRPGELAFNAPRVANLDPLDPFALSKGYQIGREKVYRIAAFMRRYFDGCENAFVSVVAPMMGIRESRRVVGDYVLTEDDHQSCRKFPDAIARNRYPVDIHLKHGVDYRNFPPGEWHDIPYRSLVVRGLDNLWVAGRCLSATFVAQSSTRIQPVCRATGEAAGAAAALAVRYGCTAREVPYEPLRGVLDLELPPGG